MRIFLSGGCLEIFLDKSPCRFMPEVALDFDCDTLNFQTIIGLIAHTCWYKMEKKSEASLIMTAEEAKLWENYPSRSQMITDRH